VLTLQPGVLCAGVHAVPWDGTDAGGVPLGAGVYLAMLRAGEERAS
jgi:hypothetical protein